MRLVSWNILQGGGRRLADILDALSGWNCDLVTLQEVRSSHVAEIADHLAGLGLRHSYMSSVGSKSENGIFLAARDPIDGGDFIQDRSGLCHILEAEVSGMSLLPVHFPQKAAQIPLFEAILQDTESLLSLDALLIGDLNCGIPFEDSTAKTFVNAARFQALKEAGWVDIYRAKNGPDARDYSWISPRSGRGFRYDHALASPSFAKQVDRVFYDHTVRENGLSDHSALLVDLGS